MNIHPVLAKAAENAPAVTYGGAVASVTFWGLHVSEICAILSTLIALIGLAVQVALALHRIRRVEHRQHVVEKDMAANNRVVEAVAESHRAMDAKLDSTQETKP